MKRRILDKITSFTIMVSFLFTAGCDDNEKEPPSSYNDPCRTMRMITVHCLANSPEDGAVVNPESVTLSWIATTPSPTYTLFLGTSKEDMKEISKQAESTYVLKDLNLCETYYWKVNAVNYCGYGCSTGVRGFMTVPDINMPFVSTSPVVVHVSSPPRLGGNVKYEGTSKITDRGVYAGLAANSGVTGAKYSIDTGTGLFSDLIPGLMPNTAYFAKAYATNNTGTAFGQEISFVTGQNAIYESIRDTDGNIYYAVNIGSQTWLTENLRTTKFNDGTEIPDITGNAEWNALLTPGYCWYNNDPGYKTTYGALYNWYAVDSAGNGHKNICPTGWHVPAMEEYSTLVNYLGGTETAGIKLKETGELYWVKYTSTAGDNSSGFSALPGGLRFGSTDSPASYQQFYYIGTNAFWWSSSGTPHTYSMETGFNQSYANILYIHDRKTGMSVRCIKDSR